MKILFVASEVVPFAKTGGLADVAGSLPIALANLGHDVRVAMPKYGSVDDEKYNLIPILDDIAVRLNGYNYTASVKRTLFPDTKVPIYFIQNAQFFDRPGLYLNSKGTDFPDNALRFAFFSKAVIWLLKGLDWLPDVIHCNDWQTAMIPVFLRTDPEVRADEGLSQVKVLYTIHNLAYQGVFSADDARQIGIGDNLFHPAGLEFYGSLNLMKGGILFADQISTVSRRYAEEIQTTEYGAGLEGVLTMRRGQLTGILNGIDYSAWSPETDKLLPAKYDAKKLEGKAQCKAALQREVGLPIRPDVPLIAMISRLDSQKGFDLIAEAIEDLLAEEVQFVLLGTGAPEYHKLFETVARQFPKKVSVNLKFDNALAHRIEAGADIFLMPSRYEPCGLNQLYSLKYGTVPVVRETGGLADSITDVTADNVRNGEGNGFKFEEYNSREMMSALRRALRAYADKPTWHQIMKNGMSRDFSWQASAREYEQLFEQMTQPAVSTIL